MPFLSNKKDNPLTHYAYYSNMALEMGVIIAIGVFGGVKLDKWLHTSPLFTLVCTLAAIAISLYVILKDLTPNKKNKTDESKDTH